jgi:DNA-binding response OmpR family regulator
MSANMAIELIQIIEDDPHQANLLDQALRKARYRTNVAPEGQSGLHDARRLSPALILLDVMLPGLDGHQVCQRLREDPQTQNIPIIMVTALGSEDHRVAGLELGADDYIAKPFSPREVVSRVRAVLRRGRPQINPKPISYQEGLVLEDNCFVASFRGKRLTLSGPEWCILRRLTRSVGEVVTREELIALLWGEDGLIHEHELGRLIQTLKRKIEYEAAEIIETLDGVGYRLASRHQ